jgi:hypothetical protein
MPRWSHYIRDHLQSKKKSLELFQSRILAFATHGLVSGEMKGLAEPALVLTPPRSWNWERRWIVNCFWSCSVKAWCGLGYTLSMQNCLEWWKTWCRRTFWSCPLILLSRRSFSSCLTLASGNKFCSGTHNRNLWGDENKSWDRKSRGS